MAQSKFALAVGGRCIVRVHGANHGEGWWEAVVTACEAREGWHRVSAVYDDPRLLVDPRVRSLHGAVVTHNADAWPIECRELFERNDRASAAASKTEQVLLARVEALTDALRAIGEGIARKQAP